MHKSVGLDEMHLWVLRELVNEVAEPLPIICEMSWHSGEVPADWEKGNIIAIFKKEKKEDGGNYRPVIPLCIATLWSRSILLETMLRHMEVGW